MAIDPKSLTVDYRTLQAIPFRDRRALLYSSYADQINSALTPSQRASLFPSYYARDAAAARSALSGVGTANRERSGAGVGFSDSNAVEGQPDKKGPPAITASEFRAVESNPFLAGYADKTVRSPGRQKLDPTQFMDPRTSGKLRPEILEKYKDKKFPVSIRNNNIGAISLSDDSNTFVTGMEGYVGKTPRPADEGGYYAKYATPEHGVAAASKNLENYYKKGINTPEGIVRKWARDANQNYIGTVVSYLNSAGYKVDQTSQLDLTDPNVRIAILKAKSAFESGAGVPVYTDDVYVTGANYAFDQEIKTAEQTTPPDAMNVVQKVASETVMASELMPQTAIAEGGATGFYAQLKNFYPDKIDKDSPLWDQIDPELKKAKHLIVDAETHLVGRDALLAADASSKVLRNNGMIPRVASGGDNHSTNHGEGRSANYSIDLAASIQTESGIKDLRVGSDISPEIKAQMAVAAKLSSENASGNFRVGMPLKDSNASMHIQVDPELPSRTWGYSEAAKRVNANMSIRALQMTEEGRSYIKTLEETSNMQNEDKSKMLASLTGIKEKETTQTVEQTKKEVEAKVNATTPSAETVATTITEQPQSQTTPIKTMAQGGVISSLGESEIVTRAPGSGEVVQRTKISEYGPEQIKVEPISKMNADALTPAKNDMNISPQANEEQHKPPIQRSSITSSKIPNRPYSNIVSEVRKPTATALRAALQIRMGNTSMGDYVA